MNKPIRNTGTGILLFIVSFFLYVSTQAQTKTFSPTGSFSLDLGVPAQTNNSAFERVYEGLFNGGVDFRYNVYNGLTVGVGGKYGFFSINTFAFNNSGFSGSYHTPSAYLMVGYEKFTTDRISFTTSLRGGYSFLMSVSDSCKANLGGPHITQTFFLEPQIEMVMLTERASPHGFSMILGYTFFFDEFDKGELCSSFVPNLTDESYQGITRFLSIGFGYRYYLGRE